jgi:very-short-patch-repair endonuclease
VAGQSGTVEWKLGRIASRSHGVVRRAQLLRAGISEAEIEHRLSIGALIRVHRSIYRVGHRAPSLEATYLAAVWACGEGAALSGRAAAYLLGLIKGRAPRPEVTAPGKRTPQGVITRRTRRLPPEHVTVCRGIPVTSVARTLVDLAGDMPADELSRACHEAGVRYRTTPGQVEALLKRRPNARGARKLRRIMGGDECVTLSRLESRFLRLLRREALPLPRTNRPAGGRYVDCRWPEYRLTVELDSYRYHNTRHAWEQDRRRERQAYARGDQFRRYTWGDVFEDPKLMLAELKALLAE